MNTLHRMQTLVGAAGEALGITEDPLATLVGARVSCQQIFIYSYSYSTLCFLLIQIEEASREDLKVENWALIMEICDIINTTEEGPQHAAKAIRRK